MNINNISFGKKIPVATCQIQNKTNGKYTPVTIYEYDCSDKSDIIDFSEKTAGSWIFKRDFLSNMKKKYRKQHINHNEPNKFYVLEDRREIQGFCQTTGTDDTTWIEYLETKPNKRYRFVGQVLLATIGKLTLEEKKESFKIDEPTIGAMPFYQETCKFKKNDFSTLEMNPKDLKKFIFRTELRTKKRIKEMA